MTETIHFPEAAADPERRAELPVPNRSAPRAVRRTCLCRRAGATLLGLPTLPFPALRPHVRFPRLRLYSRPANSFNSTVFLDSIYTH